MANTRTFSTISGVASAGDYVDVWPIVELFDPQWYPFTKMLTEYTQDADTVKSMKYYWDVQDSYPLTIDITSDDGSNTFGVSAEGDIEGMYVGCVVYSNDAGADDWRVVTSITRNGASSEFDAVNVAGTDGTGSYASGHTFYIAGSVQAEGGRAGTVEYGYTEKYNYLQPFAVELQKSDLTNVLKDRVNDAQFQKQRALVQFQKHIEMALMLGERDSSSGVGSAETNDGTLYFTGGLQYWIPTAQAYEKESTKFDMDYWWEVTEDISKYGSINKYALCGFGAYREVRKLYGDNNIQLTPEQTEFGIFNCDTIYNRKVFFIPHPGLTGDFNNTMYFIDPPYLRLKVAQPISVRDIEYGRYDKEGYKYKAILGLKPLNLKTIHSLTITT